MKSEKMKKQKREIAFLTGLCICVVLGGCTGLLNTESGDEISEIPSTQSEVAVSESEEPTEVATEVSEVTEAAETSELTGIYDDVLAQYTDMVQNHFYTDVLDSEDFEAYDACFGEDIGTEIRTREQNVYYALFDLDQNEVPELLIAASESDAINSGEGPWYYDIYTYNGTKAVHLFSDYEFGYRTNYTLMNHGVIRIDGSCSAAESITEFYVIGGDGYSPEFLDALSTVGSMEDDVVSFVYYQNDVEITEERYYAIVEGYGEELTDPIDWIQIK